MLSEKKTPSSFTGTAGPSHLPLWVSPKEEIQTGVRLGNALWGLPSYSHRLNTSAASSTRVIDSPCLSVPQTVSVFTAPLARSGGFEAPERPHHPQFVTYRLYFTQLFPLLKHLSSLVHPSHRQHIHKGHISHI